MMDGNWRANMRKMESQLTQEGSLPKISLLKSDIYSKNLYERNRMLFYVRRALIESTKLIDSANIVGAVCSGDLHNNKDNKDRLGRHYTTYMLNVDRIIVRTYHIYVNCSINDIILIPHTTATRKARDDLNKYTPFYPYEPSFQELSDIYDGEWLPKKVSPTPRNLNAPSWRSNDKVQKRSGSNETLRALQPRSNNTNNRRSNSTNFRSPSGKKQAAVSKYRPTLNTNRGSRPLSDSSSSDDENKGPSEAMAWEAYTFGGI